MKDLDWSDYAADGEWARLAVEPDGPGLDDDECTFCDETSSGVGDDVVAEFWDGDAGESILAHADCGLSRGLKLA